MNLWDHITLRMNMLAMGLYMMTVGLVFPQETYRRMIMSLIEVDVLKIELFEIDEDDDDGSN